ncbi:uncharacterized protein LOC116948751 [Petromyzon marinus]|uniref:uncharacterized protein LOC116948751 n=1 Tax=Petromyzon marinus TaxID=7757 RepID=UPI003F72A1E4
MLSVAFGAIVQGEPDPAMISPALPPDPALASDPFPGTVRKPGRVNTKRLSWARGSASWRDGSSREHSYDGDVSAEASPAQNGGYSIHTSVHEWLDDSANCDDSSAAETSNLCNRGSIGSEDDLSLGAEAGSIREFLANGVDPSSAGARCGVPGAGHSTPPMALLSPTQNVLLGGANMGSSFNSCHSILSGGSVSNLSDLLELRGDDPEGLLLELGFGEEEEDVAARVPPRFFSTPSAARGIDLRVFLRAQLQRMDEESPTIASRFRQVEVLAKVTDTFSSLYSHVRVRRDQSLAETPSSPRSPLLGSANSVASRAAQNLLCRTRWQKRNDSSSVAADELINRDDGTMDGGGGGGGDVGGPGRRGGRLRKPSRLVESPLRLEPLVEEVSVGGGVSPVLPGAPAFSFVGFAVAPTHNDLKSGIGLTSEGPEPACTLVNRVAEATADDPYPVFVDEEDHRENVPCSSPEAEDLSLGSPATSVDGVDVACDNKIAFDNSNPSGIAMEFKYALNYNDNPVDGADSSGVLQSHAVCSYTDKGVDDQRAHATIEQGGNSRARKQIAKAASSQSGDELWQEPLDPKEALSQQPLPYRQNVGRRHAANPQQMRSLSSDDSQDLPTPFEDCDHSEIIMDQEDGEREASPELVACVAHKPDGPLEQCRRHLMENFRTNSLQSDSSGFVDDSSVDLNPKRNAELFCTSHVEMGSSMESSDSCVTVRWIGAKQAEAITCLSPTSPDMSEASFLTTVSNWDEETWDRETREGEMQEEELWEETQEGEIRDREAREQEARRGEMREIHMREEEKQNSETQEDEMQEGEMLHRDVQEQETRDAVTWEMESHKDEMQDGEMQEEEIWKEDSAVASPGPYYAISTSPCDLSETDGAHLNSVDRGDLPTASSQCSFSRSEQNLAGVVDTVFEIYMIFSEEPQEEHGSQMNFKPLGSLTPISRETYGMELESSGEPEMECNPSRILTEDLIIKLEDTLGGELSQEPASIGEHLTNSRDVFHGDLGKNSIPLGCNSDLLVSGDVPLIDVGDPARGRSRLQRPNVVDLRATESVSEGPELRVQEEAHFGAFEVSTPVNCEYIDHPKTRRVVGEARWEPGTQVFANLESHRHSNRNLEEAFDEEIQEGLEQEESLSDSEQSSVLDDSDAAGEAEGRVQISGSQDDHGMIARPGTWNRNLTSHKMISFVPSSRLICSGVPYVPPSVARKIQTSLHRISVRDRGQQGDAREAETPQNVTSPLKATSPPATRAQQGASPPCPGLSMPRGLFSSERPSPVPGKPPVKWVESPRVVSSILIMNGTDDHAARLPRRVQFAPSSSPTSHKENKCPQRNEESATRKIERNSNRGYGADGGCRMDDRAKTCRTELFVPLRRKQHKFLDSSVQPSRLHSRCGEDNDVFAGHHHSCMGNSSSVHPWHLVSQPCCPEYHHAHHHHHHRRQSVPLCDECGAAQVLPARSPCSLAVCASVVPWHAAPCSPWAPCGHGASCARTLEARLMEVLCGIQLAVRSVTASLIGGTDAGHVAETSKDFQEQRLRTEYALHEMDSVQRDLLRFEREMSELEQQSAAQPAVTQRHRREWERLRALREDVRRELAQLQERLRDRRRALEGQLQAEPTWGAAATERSAKSSESPFLQHMVSELLQEQANLKLEILEAEGQQETRWECSGDTGSPRPHAAARVAPAATRCGPGASSPAEPSTEHAANCLSPTSEADAWPQWGRHRRRSTAASEVPTYRPHGPRGDAERHDAACRERRPESPASRRSSGGSRDEAAVSHGELLYLLKMMKDSMLREVRKEVLDNMLPFLTGAEFSASLPEELES